MRGNDIIGIRSEFPIFRKKIYLNSCSQGPLSQRVEAAFGRYLLSWHEQGSPWDKWVEHYEVARGSFARLVGAQPEEIAVVASASAAVNAIASALSFRERPKIVLGEFEFPTMGHIWLAQRARGAEVVFVEAKNGRLVSDDYGALIDRSTLIVPLTHVCFMNGFRTPVAEITGIAHAHGALVLLDDYQDCGTRPIDVKRMDVDFYVSGTLKYLLGPPGVAFMYVRKSLIPSLVPTVTGWFGQENPFAFDARLLQPASSGRRFEAGTPSIPSIYGGYEGVTMLQEIGLSTIAAHVQLLAEALLQGAANMGIQAKTPSESVGPLVVLQAKDAEELVRRFSARGVVVSHRHDGLRLSFHAYNTLDDVEAVLQLLEENKGLLVRTPTQGVTSKPGLKLQFEETTRKPSMGGNTAADSRCNPFPIAWVRGSFPALSLGDDFVFFDNAAGAQVPKIVLDTVCNHLLCHNVQRGGCYSKSQEVGLSIERARESVRMFLNAGDAREVAFGMNATSFTRLVSLAFAEALGERSEIIVTDLDHEANVAPWLALQSRGAEIRWWKVRKDGTLHGEDLEPLLNARTRLVACTMASNALGSIVEVKSVAKMAHAYGAEVFLDAVQYAPHAAVDVQALDCDYLVCSGYKIFGPHMGFLWGKRSALEHLRTFREHFIPDEPPAKIEAGTFSYENVAGMDAAIQYLEELGNRVAPNGFSRTRRGSLAHAMESLRAYEILLSEQLLMALENLPGVTVYGLPGPKFASVRVPVFCFTVDGHTPSQISSALANKGIGVRDGHMFSPRLFKRLGLPPESGAVRVSLAHYNTREEIDRFIVELRRITNA